MSHLSFSEISGTPAAISCCAPLLKVSQKILDELASLDPVWKIVPGRDYQTWFCLERLRETKNLFERWHNAFMLRLPPAGRLHKHTDTPETYKSFHVVVATNYRAFNCFEIEGRTQSLHLRRGHLYSFDRSVPHWAVNGGVTDRVHLICEVYA